MLSGKVLAALVSPSFENVPARLGSHALSEAVNLASLSFLGLIGPFHFILLNLRRVLFFLRTALKKILFIDYKRGRLPRPDIFLFCRILRPRRAGL